MAGRWFMAKSLGDKAVYRVEQSLKPNTSLPETHCQETWLSKHVF
jgi:hypothetical protein